MRKGDDSDNCFKLFPSPATNRMAFTFCLRKNARRARIADEAHNNFVANFISELNQDVWLGYSKDKRSSYEWRFEGQEVDFWNWKEGQPNNWMGNQNCSFMYGERESDGKWGDENCSSELPFICQKAMTSIHAGTGFKSLGSHSLNWPIKISQKLEIFFVIGQSRICRPSILNPGENPLLRLPRPQLRHLADDAAPDGLTTKMANV